VPAKAWERMKNADKNGDGKVSEEELRQAMKERGRGPGGPGGPRGPGGPGGQGGPEQGPGGKGGDVPPPPPQAPPKV
jgi:hypothetical protein